MYSPCTCYVLFLYSSLKNITYITLSCLRASVRTIVPAAYLFAYTHTFPMNPFNSKDPIILCRFLAACATFYAHDDTELQYQKCQFLLTFTVHLTFHYFEASPELFFNLLKTFLLELLPKTTGPVRSV